MNFGMHEGPFIKSLFFVLSSNPFLFFFINKMVGCDRKLNGTYLRFCFVTDKKDMTH